MHVGVWSGDLAAALVAVLCIPIVAISPWFTRPFANEGCQNLKDCFMFTI